MADEVVTQEIDEKAESPEVTFTEKDLQSAKDRAYDKARNDLQATFDEKIAQAVAEAKAQAIEESKMTAEQKAQKDLDDKIKTLEAREAGIKQRELTADITGQLSVAGLPVDLAESLATLGDAEKSQDFISSIQDVIQKQVNEEINKRANAGKPTGTPSALTNENDVINQALRNNGIL